MEKRGETKRMHKKEGKRWIEKLEDDLKIGASRNTKKSQQAARGLSLLLPDVLFAALQGHLLWP